MGPLYDGMLVVEMKNGKRSKRYPLRRCPGCGNLVELSCADCVCTRASQPGRDRFWDQRLDLVDHMRLNPDQRIRHCVEFMNPGVFS